MTQDAQKSIAGLNDSIIHEAEGIIERGKLLAEQVLALLGENANPEIVQLQNDCVLWQRKWGDVGMVGAKGGER